MHREEDKDHGAKLRQILNNVDRRAPQIVQLYTLSDHQRHALPTAMDDVADTDTGRSAVRRFSKAAPAPAPGPVIPRIYALPLFRSSTPLELRK